VPTRLKAGFIEPMLLVPTDTLPDQPSRWVYEIKFDGYRAIAFKTGGQVFLRSRNDNDFNRRYPAVVRALAALPDDTVIDGEVVALDEDGRPSFGALQDSGPQTALAYFVFDVMVLAGVNVQREALEARRALIDTHVVPALADPAIYGGVLSGPLPNLIEGVTAQGFEGLVAKRRDSRYEPGQRSGAWQKMRIYRGQEFVIGGYTAGTQTFDAVIVGYYDGDRLIYVARTRNGFTPAARAQLARRFRGLETPRCPFANLPEERSGRWGQGLTAEKMAACRWLRPELVAQIAFLEWTSDDHLRHPKFIALREDKRAKDVGRS
jgi:DNA ligase D-like protein (predicted ligase)